ncbi:MAG: RNase adapter RapZ [Lachnospiraceae bacterium]|nr:RNase adapter RapZ [Lachnospiraceae bacterium]
MKFVIVTGMSGAGKSTAMKTLEDLGFYCVDNLPVPLIDKFLELATSGGNEYEKIALGIDVREGSGFESLSAVLDAWDEGAFRPSVLFLDADDTTLVKRYKETRRTHPLTGGERVNAGIEEERKLLETIKKRADYIIDTSKLLTRDLRSELEKIFVGDKDYKNLFITILSFGFKYGIPADTDLVFDVRFLPNPYYVEELKHKTGNDKEIRDFVMAHSEAHEFLDKLNDMIEFLIPNYISEGKNQLVISIGCTGGKHRSVTLANELYKRLSGNKQYGLKIEHRDIFKDSHRA